MEILLPDNFFSPERFRSIRKALNVTLHDVGESVSVSHGYLSQVESGKKIPKDTLVKFFLATFSVSEKFFWRGEGEMFTPDRTCGRIYLAAAAKGMKISDLPKTTGLQKREVAAAVLGKEGSGKVIDTIAEVLGVQSDYLLGGIVADIYREAASTTENGTDLSEENAHAMQMLAEMEKRDAESWRLAYNTIVKIFLSSKR